MVRAVTAKNGRIMRELANIALTGFALLLAANTLVFARQRSDGAAAFAGENYASGRTKPEHSLNAATPRAQAMLGFMHEHGRGAPQDYVVASYF
jgi:TPR repeat protein